MNDKKTALQILKEVIEYHVCNPHPDYDLAMDAIERLSEQPQIVESNQICDYCATEYASIACRGCQSVNGHAGFQGRKMTEVKE